MSARSFAAGTDFINCGSAAALDDLTTATYVAWVYPTGFAAAQRIVSKNASGKVLRLTTGAKIDLVVDRVTTDLNAVSNTALTANRWAFVAGSFNTAGVAGDQKVYLGTLTSVVADDSLTQTEGAGAVVSDAAGDLLLGSNGTGQPFTGRFAWVQVYNRQLTLGELRMLQFRPTLKLAGCVGFWRPGWDNNTTVPDLSGSGNHGTVTGTSAYVAGLPLAYTTGSVARMPYTAVAASASGGKRTNRRRRRLIIRGGIQRRLR